MWCLLFAGLLAVGSHAFAPAPIQWGGLPARRFLLAPRASPNGALAPHRGMDPSPALAIWDQRGRMPTSHIPQFSVKPDKTIRWDVADLCIEAGSDESRSMVLVNHCHGGPTQLWDVLPLGNDRNNLIQLQGTNKCLQVDDTAGALNGAPVVLLECSNAATESWRFDEQIHVPAKGSIQQYTLSSSMRHVIIATFSMAALGVLSLSAWLLQKRTNRQVELRRDDDFSNTDQGCICLTTPLDGRQGSTPLTPSFVQDMVPVVMTLTPTPTENELLSRPASELMDAIISAESTVSLSRESVPRILEKVGEWAIGAEPETDDDDKIAQQRKVYRTYDALKRRGLLRGFGSCANALFPWSSKDFDADDLKRRTGLADADITPTSEFRLWPAILGYLGVTIPLDLMGYENITGTVDVIGLTVAGAVLLDTFAARGAFYDTAMRSVRPQYQDIVVKHEAGRLLAAYLLGSPIQDCVMNAGVALRSGRPRAVRQGVVVIDPEFGEALKTGMARANVIERYTVVMAAGVAAEALLNGEAKTGMEDARSIANFSDEREQNSTKNLVESAAESSSWFRWGVAQAFALLKEHRFAYDALVEALQGGASIGEAIVAIEDALDKNGELPAKVRVGTLTPTATVALTNPLGAGETRTAPVAPRTPEDLEKENADLDALIAENAEKISLANLRMQRTKVEDTEEIDKNIAESERKIETLSLAREKTELQKQVAQLQAEKARLESENPDAKEVPAAMTVSPDLGQLAARDSKLFSRSRRH